MKYLVLSLLGMLLSGFTNGQTPEEFFRKGVTQLKSNSDPKGAIRLFNKAIDLRPDYAEAYYYRGVAFAGEYDQVNSLADFNEAIALEPTYAAAYVGRAELLKNDNKDSALADYTRAIAIDSTVYSYHYKRALMYKRMGNYEKAIEDCDKVLLIEQTDVADFFILRGEAMLYLKDYEGVVGNCDEAILHTSPYETVNGRMYLMRGEAHLKLGHYAKALADLNDAESRGEGVNKAMLRMERFSDKMVGYDIANSNTHEHAWLYFLRAQAKIELKDPKGACRDFKMATKMGMMLSEEFRNYCR